MSFPCLSPQGIPCVTAVWYCCDFNAIASEQATSSFSGKTPYPTADQPSSTAIEAGASTPSPWPTATEIKSAQRLVNSSEN